MRYKSVNGIRIPLSEEEELERDAADAAFISNRVPKEWKNVRNIRNELLSASDFSQLEDSPKDKIAYKVYRKALRDITLQADPFNIVWPEIPA